MFNPRSDSAMRRRTVWIGLAAVVAAIAAGAFLLGSGPSPVDAQTASTKIACIEARTPTTPRWFLPVPLCCTL